MHRIITLFFLLLSFSIWSNEQAASDAENQIKMNKILELEINSSINPATYNYLQSGFARAKSERFNFILITMNTPGGLVSTTKQILTLFGESSIPIMIWIRPEGASATSAGAIISSGAHLLFMANGTNMGAAAPVMMGKDIDDGRGPKKNAANKTQKNNLDGASDMKKKAVNDLVALVQSLSEARGRNGEKFGEMVSRASSFTSNEALTENIIDGIANSYDELSEKSFNRKIIVKGVEKLVVKSQDPVYIKHEMDLGQSILNIFANPSLAYILFLIGAALVYLELQAPGGFVAGAVGAVCIILAGIGFQVLPLNFGALGLIVLAFALFVLEIFITSFGVLSIAGIISLILGSLFLFRGEAGHVDIPLPMIVSAVGGVVAFIGFIGFFLLKDLRKVSEKIPLNNMQGLIGKITMVRHKDKENTWHYTIKISGEIWDATSAEQFDLEDKVKVINHDKSKMSLEVGPA